MSRCGDLPQFPGRISITCYLHSVSCSGVKWEHLVHFPGGLTNQPTGLPSGLYWTILNFRDNTQLPLILTPKITSRAVSGTKVNIVDVFNYEFPTLGNNTGFWRLSCGLVGLIQCFRGIYYFCFQDYYKDGYSRFFFSGLGQSCTGLYGVTSQNKAIFICTSQRTQGHEFLNFLAVG